MTLAAIGYFVSGIVLGAVFGFIIFKLLFQKNYIPKEGFNLLQEENTSLKLENARRISQEEVSMKYVSRELHNSLLSILNDGREEIKKGKEENAAHQATILKLTSESEQKLTREEVEQRYVSKNSFELIRDKLVKAEKDLSENTQIILDLTNKLTEFREQEKNLNEKLTTFKEEVERLHFLSQEQFKNLATDILEEKKKLFIESNKSELNIILDPLKSDLSIFKRSVEDTRKEDIKDITSLKKEIELLMKLNVQLSDDAQHLANALKSEVKVQGNWGEDRLNMILETEGLQKHLDYSSQGYYQDDNLDRTRKPDFILNLPKGRHLIIDSKVSLTAYVNYFNTENPVEKSKQLQLHMKSIIDHIDELAEKNYQSLTGLNSPDYVFLFMPIEGALTLALNANPEILDRALKKKIVIITPTNLVATLKVVKILWQQENQVRNVQEIFRQCGALYDKFVLFLESMEQVGNSLSGAGNAFRDAMDHLKDGTRKGSTIIGRFDTIKRLEAKTNKSIPGKYLAELELLGDEEEKLPDTRALGEGEKLK